MLKKALGQVDRDVTPPEPRARSQRTPAQEREFSAQAVRRRDHRRSDAAPKTSCFFEGFVLQSLFKTIPVIAAYDESRSTK